MTEHYTLNTVKASGWCAKCRKQTMHRVDTGQLGPCLDCLENPKRMPTGCFYCPECKAETIHRMLNEGWTKGPCLDCEARAGQIDLFSA